MKTYKDLLHETNDQKEVKEKKQDSNLCYPSYGRGIDPEIPLNTYMVNPSLWKEAASPKKKNWVNKDEIAGEVQRNKRTKVISPKRQLFENKFEEHMRKKMVEEPLVEVPPSKRDKFDTITKVHGSQNTIVAKRAKEDEMLREMAKAMKGKTISQIEREAIITLQKETELLLDQEQINHMHEIFEQCKEKVEDTQV